MNLKSALQLNLPYRFKNICTLYPVSVLYAISFDDDDSFLNMFMPYMISKDILNDDISDISIYKLILIDEKLRNNFIETLQILCNTENIKINTETLELLIDDNAETLNEENFEEFSLMVLEMIQSKKLEKKEVKEPIFKTEEGRKRWLLLKENREKEQKRKLKDALKIYDIINIVQFGMDSYIPDEEIKKWTYWKLIKSYLTITNKKNYENSFEIYLQCGEKSLIETHWSELVKL